jgi:hypothetical protein
LFSRAARRFLFLAVTPLFFLAAAFLFAAALFFLTSQLVFTHGSAPRFGAFHRLIQYRGTGLIGSAGILQGARTRGRFLFCQSSQDGGAARIALFSLHSGGLWLGLLRQCFLSSRLGGFLYLLHPATGTLSESPLTADLDRYGLGPAVRKALANLSGIDRFLQLQATGARLQQLFAVACFFATVFCLICLVCHNFTTLLPRRRCGIP